ncbi:hypothetical protein BCY84_05655 [Trypanosoma cruzi cruzi]|nr:hypothetical protein BCY84_05655 [Trypanosoma cruzi cruzi]
MVTGRRSAERTRRGADGARGAPFVSSGRHPPPRLWPSRRTPLVAVCWHALHFCILLLRVRMARHRHKCTVRALRRRRSPRRWRDGGHGGTARRFSLPLPVCVCVCVCGG